MDTVGLRHHRWPGATSVALLGKFLCGPLADKLGGRRMFLLSLAFCAALIALFGITPYAALFAALTCAVWCAKSGGWPAMAKLVGNWYRPSEYGRVWGVLSTSSRASVVVGTFVLGGMLGFMSWEMVAVFTGVVTALLFLLCLRYLRDKPADPDFLAPRPGEEAEEDLVAPHQDSTHPLAGTKLPEALLAFAKSYRVWLICFSIMALTVLMEFLAFVPVYLQESFNLPASRASIASAVFPAGAFVAVLAGGFLYDKVSRSMRRPVFGGMLLVTVLSILALILAAGLRAVTGRELLGHARLDLSLRPVHLAGVLPADERVLGRVRRPSLGGADQLDRRCRLRCGDRVQRPRRQDRR